MPRPDNIVFDLEGVAADVLAEHPDLEGDDLHLFLTVGIDMALGIRTSAFLLADRYATEDIREIVRYVSQRLLAMVCRHTRYDYDEEKQELKTEWRWLANGVALLTFCIVDLVTEDESLC